MTSPSIDANLNPGKSGYYVWHEAVARHHNDSATGAPHHSASRVSVTPSGLAVVSSSDVQGALADIDSGMVAQPSGASVGDLLRVSGTDPVTVEAIDSGTYNRRIVRSIKEFDGYNGDGGDNTTAINNAIDALDPAQGGPGGIVWLENVTSGVTSTITEPPGVSLAGAGQGATTVRADAAMDAVIVFTGKKQRHYDFKVDGNGNATNTIVVQNTARSIFSNIDAVGGITRNWYIDEDWFGTGGNNVLTIFEWCLASGASTSTTTGWDVLAGTNSNGMLFLQCYGHNCTGAGMQLSGLANRVVGGTWVGNGTYGIDVNGGQSHYLEQPWLENNGTDGMVFSDSVRSHVYLATQAGQGVDWANSQEGNSEGAVRNTGGLASHVYRASVHPKLGDDARAPSDGVNTFPFGYSVFKDAAGNFPAGAGGHVETYADGAEGRQRNWAEGSNVIRERTSTDGATWQPWRIRGDAFPIYLPGVLFRPVFGSPTENQVSRHWGLSFPDSTSDQRVEKQVYVPEGSGLTVTLYWANETTATGTVKWDILRSGFSDGRDLTQTQSTLQGQSPTAEAQNVLVETAYTTTFASAGEVMSFVINRPGGSDTLAGPATVFGLLIHQA